MNKNLYIVFKAVIFIFGLGVLYLMNESVYFAIHGKVNGFTILLTMCVVLFSIFIYLFKFVKKAISR